MTAPIVRTLAELREYTTAWHKADEVIGAVPTMGALHQGHLSLVRAAKEQCDRVIVTIFVNPKQFDNPDDLKNYPRTEHEDAKKLASLKVDVIYVPNPEEIYPDGFATTVSVSGLTDMLCGAARPGHFDGVATVVSKLFMQTQADKAFFGEKDYQQLQIVTRLAADLNIPIDVVGCPTIREEDGLAMSSRNLLLSDRSRIFAPLLAEVMGDIADALNKGEAMGDIVPDATARLLAAGFNEVDYLELRDGSDLSLLNSMKPGARLFAAAWLAGVRLIDNIAV
ncbi:pantothenate synthetase [Octadecabacter temperatus]|uniref:Pantothenate synthetase n=1 Tax=Octadecabacter temperatus TaxID=1458307 RepID=A0A0K0Y395_9RHOB|nr:pantoate--beta-alanine ligase [Octadecabacter temperatus]AKS45337.1 Pantothenate synthetase [Octadecabacter temperatus]SIN90796.1 pantothenate synthetase [Octadecabacter temperatus]